MRVSNTVIFLTQCGGMWDVGDVECGMWNVDCGMWDVGYVGSGHVGYANQLRVVSSVK